MRSPEAVARRERKAERDAADVRRLFETAPFPAHGLDERWPGLRWFGGHGSSNGGLDHVGLAHGDAWWDPAAPQVRVDTYSARVSDNPGLDRSGNRWTVPLQLVHALWRRTGVLDREVRRAAFPLGERRVEPTEPWRRTDLAVNRTLVPARFLSIGDVWVAMADLGDILVAIEGERWPLEETGLVTFADLAPYEQGAVEITRRRLAL
jgi:hypothetical protein